jgi:NADPH:quinone reductase-like Zn-dependent oxidoreductase
MRSYHGNLGGGIEGVVLRQHPQREPAPNEVLIRVRAASINARDTMIFAGQYSLPVKPDVVLLADGAGEVISIGAGVSRAKVGDRVACTVFPRWIDGRFDWDFAAQLGGSLDGMLTEFAIVGEQSIVSIPDHLSFEEAATLPCAGVTAWNALNGNRPPLPGDTVLTLGSGSVSLFAIGFAKMAGARVIATTSSDEKAAKLRALGADDVVNYRDYPEWHIKVRELTDNRGVDHVIDVGGGGTLAKSLRATALEGQVAAVGWLSNESTSLEIRALAGSVATIRRIAVGSRAHFVAMLRAIALSGMKPTIDSVFPFNDAVPALHYYSAGHYFGKTVISMP